MNSRLLNASVGISLLGLVFTCNLAPAQTPTTRRVAPEKVYVPYEQLKDVFEQEGQGVFLPYGDFQRLWRAAQGTPAGVGAAPVPYLISTARFSGKIEGELALIQLELTVDVLVDGWVEVPIGLGDVAVARIHFADAEETKATPLLHIADGRYLLVTKGSGRRVLKLNFVRQLVSKPGLKILSYRLPPAAITTLELVIPEENMKVNVEPLLAATTTQETVLGLKATKLQAFLGSADTVKLSWQPKTQAAADLEAVVIAEQFQHIHVSEALITHEIKFDYDIRRRGLDSFAVQLPGDFRVTSVEGANINRWDISPVTGTGGKVVAQILRVKLFSPAEGKYKLTVKMERFLQAAQAKVGIFPIVTQQVLRRTGLIAITHSSRRSVEVEEPKNLARVDAGRLPEQIRKRPGTIAYRFITAEYGGTMVIGTVRPRVTVNQRWAIGVRDDRLELQGQLKYKIERSGMFSLKMNLPEPWKIISIGPNKIVEDHKLTGRGRTRQLDIMLRKEVTGSIDLNMVARAPRARPDELVSFDLPLADKNNLQLYSGQLVLLLPEHLRAEVQELKQLQSLPLNKVKKPPRMSGLGSAMAFEFRTIDYDQPARAVFKIAVKPTQISAVVHRLVNIQPGSIDQEAVVQYKVLYSPVDTFYLKMPASLADAGVQITGRDIKEKPRIDKLPDDQKPRSPTTTRAVDKWAYYKIVLQSPRTGRYELKVRTRRSFQVEKVARTITVTVEPILAAGKLSDQSGHVAVAKADMFAIGEPKSENLIPADPGSAADLPYRPHRKRASLAFKYDTPPFWLSLPVAQQEEVAVFTTIARGAVIEQVIARDGTLNTHAIYLLSTRRGDRLAVTLPPEAKLFAMMVNGAEVPVEAGTRSNEHIVRLPPSAGQITKVVLEISYGLDEASATKLSAPALPKEIPVQQTLWRLWVPDQSRLLAFDRAFSRIEPDQAGQLLSSLGRGQPSAVEFKLAPQGNEWDFIRQGRPGELAVTLVDEEFFVITVWAVIIVVGVVMLKFGGFVRCLVVLAVAVAASIVRLFAPLMIEQLVLAGMWSALIVAVLWLAKWLFVTLPRRTVASLPPPPAKPSTAKSDNQVPRDKE